jgi:hypothetical protein
VAARRVATWNASCVPRIAGAFEADGVHQREQVVHLLLRNRHVPRSVREARPTLVDDNKPREVPETTEEVRRRGMVPQQIELRDEPEQVDQLDLSIAYDRVRDVVLPPPRVPNVEEVTNPRVCSSWLHPLTNAPNEPNVLAAITLLRLA